MLQILRQIDANHDGMSYDIMWDLCEVMRESGQVASADLIDKKMMQLVAKNMLNHEKNYEGMCDIYELLLAEGHQIAADSFKATLENLARMGMATKPELN